MDNPLHNALNRALSIRLSMQISLSGLPVVEEWMDNDLGKWLDGVPLPPELPTGQAAHLDVVLGSDLSRLAWRAYGHPAGFVPKLLAYFDAVKVARADLQLLDDIGTQLQPALVGTWIAVEGGQVGSGWHFCDEHAVSALVPFLADSPATAALTRWLNDAGIERFRRFSQSVGAVPYTDVEVPLPGVSPDDMLAAASRAFEALSGEGLPASVTDAMAQVASTEFTAAVRIIGGEIARVSVVSPGLANDAVAAMCEAAGVACAAERVQVQAALGVDACDRVAYSRQVGPDGAGAPRVDLVVVPTENQRPNPQRMN